MASRRKRDKKRSSTTERPSLVSAGSHRSLASATVPQDFNPDDQEAVETTPLHYAAGTGNVEALEQQMLPELLAETGIDSVDHYGRTPLIYTVLADSVECTDVILNAGGNIDAVDADGRTAMHWAAFHGKHKMLKFLISRGANCMVRDKEGRTCLHLSTGCESSKCTKQICRRLTPDEVNAVDKEHMTAAHWAAFHDHPKHMDQLISAGANLLAGDSEGKVPLHWVSDNESAKTTARILAADAQSVNVCDQEGRTPLHLAVADNNIDVANVMTSTDSCKLSQPDNMRRTPLHWASVLGASEVAALLVDRGADCTCADENGATALHYAAVNEDPQCLATLLQFPNVADMADLEGRTALMWAASKGTVESVQLMAGHNFDLQASDNSGGTALHAAAFAGNNDCVVALLQGGAVVDALDAMNHSPMFRACEMGHVDVVITLINAGASLDVIDVDGRSAVHWAALGGHDYICRTLVESNAPHDERDSQGRTPLQCAAYGGHIDTMNVFLVYHAEVNAQDNEGICALHWACSGGHLDAVKLLMQYNAAPNQMEADGDKLTPLDYALIGQDGQPNEDIVEYMVAHNGFSSSSIKEVYAVAIQQWWRRLKGKQKGTAQRRKAAASRAGEEKKRKQRQAKAKAKADQDAAAARAAADAASAAAAMPAAAEAERPSTAARDAAAREEARKAARELEKRQRKEAQSEEERRRRDLEAQRIGRETALLQESKIKSQMIRREQNRLLDIRRAIESARIIQLAWRRYVLRCKRDGKQRRRAGGAGGGAASRRSVAARHGAVARTAPAGATSGAAGSYQAGSQEWREQIAALTIQLAFRQHMRRKMQAERYKEYQRRPKWASSVRAEQQRSRVAKVYTQQFHSVVYRPSKPSRMQRPSYMHSIASPAVLSFNFAVDSYQPRRAPATMPAGAGHLFSPNSSGGRRVSYSRTSSLPRRGGTLSPSSRNPPAVDVY